MVSAFTTGPYDYRYVPKALGGGVARFEVVPEEACVVRLIFAWIELDRVSLREVCRRLQQAGVVTRRGSTRWHASTLGGCSRTQPPLGAPSTGMLAIISGPPKFLRPLRGHPNPCHRPSVRVKVPREDWIEVPVPALVDPAVFEAAQTQLQENRQRKRASWTGPHWLPQGLTICRRCGYAYYGKTAPQSKWDPSKGDVLLLSLHWHRWASV